MKNAFCLSVKRSVKVFISYFVQRYRDNLMSYRKEELSIHYIKLLAHLLYNLLAAAPPFAASRQL